MKSKSRRAKCIWNVQGIDNRCNTSSPSSTTSQLQSLTSENSMEHPFSTDDYNKHLCTVLCPELSKFYRNRFSLFSLYNSGIVLDKEGWYSVTPEEIAKKQANRLSSSDIIVDLCCGCGGNSIQFAMTSYRVYAIDIDSTRLRLARYNANIYNVESRIQFILADWLTLIDSFRHRWADAVFMSPPWGGMSYSSESEFDLDNLFPGLNFVSILKKLSLIAPSVNMFLPRNTSHSFLIEAARESGATDLEIEVNKIGNFHKGITVYLNYI